MSRFAGQYEHVFETTTAGITIQAPQVRGLVWIIFILSHCGISRTLNSDTHSLMYELFCYPSDLHLIKYFQILLEKGKLNLK